MTNFLGLPSRFEDLGIHDLALLKGFEDPVVHGSVGR